MIKNPYNTLSSNPTGLVETWLAVTPNNETNNVGTDTVAIGMYVTVGGAVSWRDVSGTTITVTVPSNFYINCSVTRVLSTGTTATGIFALISA
jgi:hypothetical protein